MYTEALKVVSNNQVEGEVKKLNLIEGHFNPTEAREILTLMIEENINLLKLKSLKSWVGNHSGDTDYLDQKISSLKDQKEQIAALIREAQKSGYDLSIDGSIEIKFTKSK